MQQREGIARSVHDNDLCPLYHISLVGKLATVTKVVTRTDSFKPPKSKFENVL